MSLEQIRFSSRLQREQHVSRFRGLRPYLRFCAFFLTIGEVMVGYLLFKHTDYLGCYAVTAYLAKEHVIARVIGRE